jgi:hypothetical protein
MPKFYEIKLFTGVGYFSLIIFSYLGFSGGRGLPIGLILIPIPFIIELIISIYYLMVSMENKKIHFLCFSVIFFISAVIFGIGFDIYETENTRKYLMNMGNLVEKYILSNDKKELTDQDIMNINLPRNIIIDNIGDTYILRYKDGTYNSETKTVYFRPRP